MVDGVLASCYADFDHDLAHFIMKPTQWFPHIMEWIFGEDTGFPFFVNMARELGIMSYLMVNILVKLFKTDLLTSQHLGCHFDSIKNVFLSFFG